ncbi:MAG: M20/M25/M40 family metallo-hydrolase [Phycisphaerae bacterium]
MPEQHKRTSVIASLTIGLIAAAGLCGAWVAGDERDADRNAGHAISIAGDTYVAHIALLAHDELGGRGTGSDGIDIAAGYIAGQFAAAGLEPGGPDGTYFQPFTIPRGGTLQDTTELVIDGADVQAELRTDFMPFGFSTPGSFEGDVVFAGYGITNPDKDYDDYARLDVTGKVVLMLRREPPGWSDGPGFTQHATFRSKVSLAADKGAVAVLIVNQDPGDDGSDDLMPFRPGGETYGIPAIHVKRSFGEKLLAPASSTSLGELQRRIDETGRPVSAARVHVRGRVDYKVNEIVARNVIGVLPGTGPHADEYVVIGGHYDHLGNRRGNIHNGADDNASGTAGVIEAAKALAQMPYRDRSVICMTFTGEEMGLLGSAHFTNDPTVPIDAIVAMLNMDMIGRLDSDTEANKLAIQGLGTGDAFQAIVDERTSAAGIDFIPDPSARGPSDHASFYNAGVPSLFFFTGVHSDYHQPGDDTEKINAAGGAKIAELVCNIALDLINRETAPQYAVVNERANIFRGAFGRPGRGGVVMGIFPDRDDDPDKPGWRVARVMDGGGAAKAGMKDGDSIIDIDGRPINGLADYRDVTGDKKPGDVIAVKVQRGDAQIVLNVKLAARGG